ncbi:hypothetical protein [Coxiella endosymbiont of Ornithodoros maritimus]|uniref:hypothetical protein n=1 Tax=Coxiella endosymbiont of Ornithodoros maritimus TaxID=1656172 RepID=UPI002B400377|nr:hypothetical protein [Coxiella endosymbiont of Ornithodoros maritimus]
MSRRERESKVEPNYHRFQLSPFLRRAKTRRKKESLSEASSAWMLPSNRLIEEILSAPDTKAEAEIKPVLIYNFPEEEAKLVEEGLVD